MKRQIQLNHETNGPEYISTSELISKLNLMRALFDQWVQEGHPLTDEQIKVINETVPLLQGWLQHVPGSNEVQEHIFDLGLLSMTGMLSKKLNTDLAYPQLMLYTRALSIVDDFQNTGFITKSEYNTLKRIIDYIPEIFEETNKTPEYQYLRGIRGCLDVFKPTENFEQATKRVGTADEGHAITMIEVILESTSKEEVLNSPKAIRFWNCAMYALSNSNNPAMRRYAYVATYRFHNPDCIIA